MTSDEGLTIHKSTAVLVAVALLAAGAGAAYVFMRRDVPAASSPAAAAPTAAATPSSPPAPPSSIASTAPLPDVVISLSTEAIARAGIVTAPVSTAASASGLRLPGIVEPNAYKQVAVTPLVGGRITRVSAELGDRVRRGQTLAQIYSPQLAEAQTKYVSAKAMLDAHDRELQRTQKLVEIGAASRQELERIHAEHAAQAAEVQSARSQLQLLGVPAPAIDRLGSGANVNASTSVPAPIDGIVTDRTANAGLNVDQTTTLFKVVDLATVWVVADLYERDFARVRVGADATITTNAYPGVALRGRVSYIDPQVSAETRTARIRVEVPNPRGELRLGLYADVAVTGVAGRSAPAIPRTAIQNVGDRTVVYVANPKEPGKFTEREVRLADTSGEQVEVLSGLQQGDLIVTEGSFFVRAERERLGLRSNAGAAAAAVPGPPRAADAANPEPTVQKAKVVISDKGFEPARFTLRAGTPAQLTFLRTSDATCATEVVFPSLKIKRPLPLNQAVVIQFTPAKTGEISFACGMNMLKGLIVIE
jgi:RND family efflux transporter MFP subunit